MSTLTARADDIAADHTATGTATAARSLRCAHEQPLGPERPSKGPDTMANGGIQKILADLGATVRVEQRGADASTKTPNTAAGRSSA